MSKQRLAMSLVKPRSPEWWLNWSNLITSVAAADGEEAGWRESEVFLRGPRGAKGPKAGDAAARECGDVHVGLAALPRLQTVGRLNHNGAGGNAAIIGPQVADIYALMHDPAQAARSLTASDPDDLFTKA